MRPASYTSGCFIYSYVYNHYNVQLTKMNGAVIILQQVQQYYKVRMNQRIITGERIFKMANIQGFSFFHIYIITTMNIHVLYTQ